MADQAAGSSGDEQEEGNEFLPGFATLEDYSKSLLSQVVQATKSANGLPAEGDDFDYYASFPGFKTFCAKMGARINKSISKLMRHQQLPCYWPSGGGGAGGGAPTPEDLEERFESMVEANDVLLERVSILLDEASGVKKTEKPVLPSTLQQGTAEVASWNKKKDSIREAVGSYKFIHAKNVQRPQLQFQDKIDNSTAPFIPLLREKPNALKPLPEMFQRLQNPTSLNALIANAKEWASSDQRFEHPYQYELDHLEPREEQLQLREPQSPGSLEDTPLSYVDTPEQLQELKEKLCSVSDFAVDLEHHSYRSYQGFVCLMQVSTRDHDYIIDALELRQHMHILLDPFTNPAIVKVMHGADWDILWLQRDFGIYVVNLFDTGQASRILSLPRFSLAFLLQYCCNVQADKQYQLADWRIRPLPPELSKYAREDTHYLLYIYDRMRNELLRRGNKQSNLLHSVLDRSRDICLKRYQKPAFAKDGYLYLYNKHKRTFNTQQLHCLQLLYAWRDRVAREEDESMGYVLPNHMLFQISEILPREPQGLLACCNPIPTLLRTQLQEVYMLVQQARETPLTDRLPTLGMPVTVSSPARLPAQDHTPLATPTLEDEPDGATGLPHRTHLKVTGQPVGVAKPAFSVFEDIQPSITQSVQKKLEVIRSSLPDILSKFLEARVMTPSEVVLRRTLSETSGVATPTSAPGTPAASRTLSESPLVKAQVSPVATVDTPTGPQTTAAPSERLTLPAKEGGSSRGSWKGKDKRKLSVREMGGPSPGGKRKWGSTARVEGEWDGAAVRKKPRVDEGGGRRELEPFVYEGVQFTDFTEDSPTPVTFSPHDQEGGRQRHSGPRSRVHQKFGERSHTYTQGRSMGKRQSWPGVHK